jgi:hypothetical protein
VKLSCLITREELDACYAVLHFGGHDVRCAVRVMHPSEYERARSELTATFDDRSIGDAVRAVDRWFSGEGRREYGLSDLFLDQRRHIVGVLVEDLLERRRRELFDLFDENVALLRFLADTDTPIPAPLAAAADYTLARRFLAELDAFERGEHDGEELLAIERQARALGRSLDLAPATASISERLRTEMQALAVAPRRETARVLCARLELAARLGLAPDLWETQNLYWELMRSGPRGPDADADLLIRLGLQLGFDRVCVERTWRPTARSAHLH